MKTESKRLSYVRFDAGYFLAKTIEMTAVELGEYFKKLLICLASGRRGVLPEADEMLDEAQAYFSAKRKYGSMGGSSTQRKRASSASSDASSTASSDGSSYTDRQTDKHIDRHTNNETSVCDFDQFWKAYPKKLAKGDASKAWQTAKNLPDIQILIAALELQKATADWRKDNGKFIPYPATWIRAAGWENDVAAMNASHSASTKSGRIAGRTDWGANSGDEFVRLAAEQAAARKAVGHV